MEFRTVAMAESALVFITEKYNRNSIAALGARIHSHTFIPLAGTPLVDTPPGTVDEETRNVLGRLAGEGKQFGSWARQERFGRELARFRARHGR
jgi:hypothetical protein